MRVMVMCLATGIAIGIVGALAACSDGDRDNLRLRHPDESPGEGAADETVPGAPPPLDNPGPSPLRRLSKFQLQNTVEDLLGPEARTALGAIPDDGTETFDTVAESQTWAVPHATALMEAAEKLGAIAVTKLQPSCETVGKDGAACARSLVEGFGARLFRRPLTKDEADRYAGVYDRAQKSNVDHRGGLGWMFEAMFQAPQFLYLRERGHDGTLTSYEIASRLSYFLLQSTPDEELLAAAGRDELDSDAKLVAQADRLMKLPRARTAVGHFHEQWLAFADVASAVKSATLYPEVEGLKGAMIEEARTFADRTFWEDGTLGALLSAPYTYVNAPLAKHYGLTPPSGDGFQKVAVDPAQRAGLLTQAYFLASASHSDQTSTTLRGKFVMERLLCRAPSPPPQAQDLGAVGATKTARERGEKLSAAGTCSYGCHASLDPVGFAFESFDPVGRWRTVDNGQPVNDDGSLSVPAPTPIDGAVDLARKLSASAEVRHCFVTQWLSYGAGRMVEPATDTRTVTWLEERAKSDADLDARRIVASMVRTAPFRRRGSIGTGQGGQP